MVRAAQANLAMVRHVAERLGECFWGAPPPPC
jgi:hypothetical protein